MKQQVKDILFLIFMLIWIFWAVQSCSESMASAVESTPVERYIQWFLQHKPKRMEAALKLAPIVTSEAQQAGFHPLLISVMISCESSWLYKSEGGAGEIGLLQVMPDGVCAKGQDLTTPEGQIKAGVNCLKLARDRCGHDLTRVLTMYASGRCVSQSERTKALIKRRLKLFDKAKGNFE